jgi:hypothetical protein
MPNSVGINKRTAYAVETVYGVVPSAVGAKYIRRVKTNFNLAKDTYESNEIRTDYQRSDFRHGLRSVKGSISGELSAGTYSDFLAAVVAKDFTVNPTITGLGLTIAVSGKDVTVTRGAGSWITDLFVPGQVARITTGTGLVAANQNNNLFIIALTATVMTARQVSGTAFVAGAPTACTVQAFGKSTLVPLSGHTNKSYSFEEWFSDVAQSEVYSGLKIGDTSVSMPTNGLVTIDFTLQGKVLAQKAITQYFTTPANPNTNGIFAAVSGSVIINNVPQGVVSTGDFKIMRKLENANVIGQDSVADVFVGRITSSGTMSMYFENAVPRDIFDNEGKVGVMFCVVADASPAADFMTFYFPSVKFSSADKTDAELGIMQSVPFEALLNGDLTGGKPPTTVYINDSQA